MITINALKGIIILNLSKFYNFFFKKGCLFLPAILDA